VKVLFVCVENAGRSQMAEAFAKRLGISATSAGTLPATTVNPVVVQVMRKRGIDLSSNRPRMLTVDMVNEADLVVTMGCSAESVCPAPTISKMRKKLEEWNLEDPKDQPVEKVRHIADEIERKVAGLPTHQPTPRAYQEVE
jgi:arsenate reductase